MKDKRIISEKEKIINELEIKRKRYENKLNEIDVLIQQLKGK